MTDLLSLHLVCLGMLSQGAGVSVPLRAPGMDARVRFLKHEQGRKQCYCEKYFVVNR